MSHIRKYNENNKVDAKELIYFFAELSDDYLKHKGNSFHRNIAIEVGEYFRSKPFLLNDIANPFDDVSKNEADQEEDQKISAVKSSLFKIKYKPM